MGCVAPGRAAKAFDEFQHHPLGPKVERVFLGRIAQGARRGNPGQDGMFGDDLLVGGEYGDTLIGGMGTTPWSAVMGPTGLFLMRS